MFCVTVNGHIIYFKCVVLIAVITYGKDWGIEKFPNLNAYILGNFSHI